MTATVQQATSVRSGRLTALQRRILLAMLENEEIVEPGWPELLKAASADTLAKLIWKEKLGTKAELSTDGTFSSLLELGAYTPENLVRDFKTCYNAVARCLERLVDLRLVECLPVRVDGKRKHAYKAHNRVKLRARHAQSPRSQKTPHLHPNPSIHHNHIHPSLNPGNSPRHSRNPNSLNHPKMDPAKHRYNALPKAGASPPNTPVNAHFINSRVHISSLEICANKIRGATLIMHVARDRSKIS